MCLLSYILDTVGLFLRIWLWISVPMAVLILLVATWLNYRQHIRPKVGLNLAMEGWAGEKLPGNGGAIAGTGLSEVEGCIVETGVSGGGDVVAGRNDGSAAGSAVEVETGGETIYRGILWMKEKYEQYREQADRRYDQLKQDLGRSERRYHELVAAMEQAGRVVQVRRPGFGGMEVGPGPDGMHVIGDYSAMTVGEGGAEVLKAELCWERQKVGELERELSTERSKVEELMVKLQANSQLLMTIYQELDKSIQTEKLSN